MVRGRVDKIIGEVWQSVGIRFVHRTLLHILSKLLQRSVSHELLMKGLLFALHSNKCTAWIRFDSSELTWYDLDRASAVSGACFGRLEALVAFSVGVVSDRGYFFLVVGRCYFGSLGTLHIFVSITVRSGGTICTREDQLELEFLATLILALGRSRQVVTRWLHFELS